MTTQIRNPTLIALDTPTYRGIARPPAPPKKRTLAEMLALPLDGKVVAVAQTKGGSCKSTTVKQVAGMFAAEHPQLKIGILDLDPQCHQGFDKLNKNYYPHTEEDGGLTKLMEDTTRRKISDAKLEQDFLSSTHKTSQENVVVLSGSMQGIKDLETGPLRSNPTAAKKAVKKLINVAKKHYDLVIIDTAGTSTSLLLEFSLAEADALVEPVDMTSTFSVEAAINTVTSYAEGREEKPIKVGVVLTPLAGGLATATINSMKDQARIQFQAAIDRTEGAIGRAFVLGAIRKSNAIKLGERGAPLAVRLPANSDANGQAVVQEIRAVTAAMEDMLF